MSCYRKAIDQLVGNIIVTPFIPSMSGGMMYRIAIGYGTPLYSEAQGKGYGGVSYSDVLGLTRYSSQPTKQAYNTLSGYGVRPTQVGREYGGPPLRPTFSIPEPLGGLEEKLPREEGQDHKHNHEHVHPHEQEHMHHDNAPHIWVHVAYEPSDELEKLSRVYTQQRDLAQRIKKAQQWTTTNVLSVPKV